MKLKGIINGVGSALAITAMGTLFITGYILLDQGTAYYLPRFSFLLALTSCLVGGSKATAKASAGWWWQPGVLVGMSYVAITSLSVNMLFPTAINNWEQVGNWLTIIMASVVGSFTGYYYRRTVAFRFRRKTKARAINK